MKKRILLVLTVLTMLLCVPLIANAASVNDLTFDAATGMITHCNTAAEGELVIPEEINGVKVTSIGNYAFYYCTSLTSINIPGSVTSIGEYAFASCHQLTNITIPGSVTSIGEYAFFYCKSLTSITIPNSVTSIGDWAFADCTSLTSINIPNGVTNIGYRVFYDCTSLTSINIPNSVTNIGYRVFYDCTSLTSINIPNSVTSIGEEAFYGCKSLTSINIPDSVTSIGDDAFYNTGYYNNPANWINNVLYIGDCLICANDELSGAYYIKSGTRIIADSAFRGCKSLTSITIPNGVTNIGEDAFYNCESLTSITIPDSVTSIGEGAFYSCESLTDVYYSGTEREWKLIEIWEFNDNLLNATIHFAAEPLEVQPVEPETDTEANKITIPVTVTDAERAAELNGVRLYIAEYDADGRLTNLTFGTKDAVEGNTVTFTADIPDAEHYKIMLWDANNVPLMNAVDSV